MPEIKFSSDMRSTINKALRDFLGPLGLVRFGYENYIKDCFKRAHGYPPDLKKPKTFSEKIQWMKIYGRLERFSKYVDKYAVREFIKERAGEELLIPLVGVYKKTKEIDYKFLPNSFVMKATHGCGWNIIVKDKTELDWHLAREKMHEWLKLNFYKITGQPNYKPLKGRIIIEKYIEDSIGDLKDYKFFCFHGEPRFVQVDGDRFTEHKRDFYDLNWNKLPVKLTYANLTQPIAKPEKLCDMIEICRKLSRGFAFVRVDLYFTDGRIYFGELTFTPDSGFHTFSPVQYDAIFGKLLDLNNYCVP
jgi:hypothetical protein